MQFGWSIPVRWGLVLALLVTTPGRAAADTTAHLGGTGAVGYTDNYLSAPADPPPGQDAKEGSLFLESGLGVLVQHAGPRSLHRFLAHAPVVVYPGHEDGNSVEAVGAWNGLFTLSPRAELTLGTSAGVNVVNQRALRDATAANLVQAQPVGRTMLFQTTWTEGYTLELTPAWSFLQSASVNAVAPLDTPEPEASRLFTTAEAGATRTTGRDAWTFTGSVGVLQESAVRSEQIRQDPGGEMLLGSRALWRHDWNAHWSTRGGGGALLAVRTTDFAAGAGTLVWEAGLTYSDDFGTADLSYTRDMAPSLLMSELYLSDTVQLQGAVPLHREWNLVATSTAGYSVSRTVDLRAQELTAVIRAWAVDGAVGWTPPGGFSTFLRFQHLQQLGDEEFELPSYARNTILLTVEGWWPPLERVEVPEGPAQRVDGTDRRDPDRELQEQRSGRRDRAR